MTATASKENGGRRGVEDITHPPFQHRLSLVSNVKELTFRTSPWSHQTSLTLAVPIQASLSRQRGTHMGTTPPEGP